MGFWRIERGSLFQDNGPETEKARGPNYSLLDDARRMGVKGIRLYPLISGFNGGIALCFGLFQTL